MMTLRRLWEFWKRFAELLGNVQARVLLSLFYLLACLPFGVGVRLFSDPLRLKPGAGAQWLSRVAAMRERWEQAHRQF